MSKQLQAKVNEARTTGAALAPQGHGAGQWRPGLPLALALVWLSACSTEEARRDSELQVKQAAPTQAASAPATDASADAAATAPAASGSYTQRYRVVAGTAYFYTSPRQAKPSGQYLLRGDVLYGQDDENGFVKTQFVNPQGATVTGWLKAEELGQLAATAATRAARPRPTAPAAVSTPLPTDNTAVTDEAASLPAAATSRAATAVVQVARAYFYNSPDLLQPRKAYCEKGDKVRLGEEQGDAVYVTFTNWEKVTTRGWMRRDELH
jgi:hypothetical protein